MKPKAYLSEPSVRGHESMVATFVEGMVEHWGRTDIHLSCDTAIARGVGESRLELRPMIDWDTFIGDRQIHELAMDPSRRHYHRYLPFPRSLRQSLDEWATEKIRISLHHQLLTGVVIYIDPREFTSVDLDELESSVVRKRIALFAPGHYWRNRIDVTSVTAKDDCTLVERIFEQLWEARANSAVMQLFYKYPKTFESARYVPFGVRSFIAYLQNYRCPCQNGCNLNQSGEWDIDHVIPISQAGTNVLINLQATCSPYNRERKKQRPEARTVSYPNVMNDPRWQPRILSAYQRLLLNQRCGKDVLSKIENLNRRRMRAMVA